MSVRTPRRTFAAPFVITMAGCMVQSGPPPRGARPQPQPQPVSSTPSPAEPGVMANPPHPGAQQAPPKPTHAASWTVMQEGSACKAYVNVSCPKGAMCNPPPPTDYACMPQVTPKTPVKVVRNEGSELCQIDFGPMSCPANATCNPPPPQRVTCPQ